MDPVLASLLGAIFGGGCAIVGAWFGAKFAVDYQMKKSAKRIFSDTVHEILVGMYPEPINWPKNSWQILQDKMPEMHLAIQKVVFHLTPAEVSRINTAWAKYKEYCYKINDQEIAAAQMFKESMPYVDQKVIFKKHVDLLLSYSSVP